MGSQIKHQTICKISLEDGARCGHVIVTAPEMKVPEIGLPTDEKVKAFVQAIAGHMMKKHPQLAAIMMNTWEQFLGHQALCFTDSEDPNVPLFMAQYSAYLASISIVTVSDEALETLVGRMDFTLDDPRRAQVIQAMKYLRSIMSRQVVPAGNPG